MPFVMKHYDRDYYESWYRGSESPVATARELGRTVRMALGIAEYFLCRPIRNVLDIGCGEARWRAPLRRERPKIRYVGVETSDYVIRRYGRARNIVRGTFGGLRDLDLDGPFDLIVCSDVLHYLPAREIDRGLESLGDLLGGVAYLDVATAEDEPEGDLDGWHRRGARWYRQRFERAGLVEAGMQCWVAPEMVERLGGMERLNVEC